MDRAASSNKSSGREHPPRLRIRVFSAGTAPDAGNRAIKRFVREGFELAVSDSCSAEVSSAFCVGAPVPEPGSKPHRQIHRDFDDLPASSVGARSCP